MKSVLLVEDDRWLADSYYEVLETKGYKCAVASTVEEALEIVNHAVPQVIIADIMLCDHTAIGLLHELQSYDDTQNVPVIVCSSIAKSVLHVQEQLHEYGVVEILDKATITPDELAKTVEEYS